VLGRKKPPSRVATNGQLQWKHLKNTPTGNVALLPWLILRKLVVQRSRSESASAIPRMSSGIAEASGAEIGSPPGSRRATPEFHSETPDSQLKKQRTVAARIPFFPQRGKLTTEVCAKTCIP
jgi:hypothetical protein